MIMNMQMGHQNRHPHEVANRIPHGEPKSAAAKEEAERKVKVNSIAINDTSALWTGEGRSYAQSGGWLLFGLAWSGWAGNLRRSDSLAECCLADFARVA